MSILNCIVQYKSKEAAAADGPFGPLDGNELRGSHRNAESLESRAGPENPLLLLLLVTTAGDDGLETGR